MKPTCQICNKVINFSNKTSISLQKYCSLHQKYIKNNNFTGYISTISNPDNPDDSLLLYKIKDILWKKEFIICYTTEEYINKGESILTIVTLFICNQELNKINSYFVKYFN